MGVKTRHMSKDNEPIDYVDEWNELPKFMTRNGPGDHEFVISPLDGKVDTSSWFVDQLTDEVGDNTGPWNYNPDVLKEGSIAQMSKDQEIFFCDIPFGQIYTAMGGEYAACCFGAEANGKDGLPHNTVYNTTLLEWMEEGEYMNNIRKEMLDPNSDYEWVKKTCKRCIADEHRYGRSRRTACMKIHSNDQTYWDKIDYTARMFKATGEFKLEQRVFEVQLKVYGDECNLDCYMCMHNNSSIRQKVALEGVWNQPIWDMSAWKVPLDNEGQPVTELDGLDPLVNEKSNFEGDNVESMIEQTVAIAPYINSIKIIGGEPLIMKKHYELLNRLIEVNEAKNITIKYQTNLTETKAGKHNIFDYIPHFKLVCMVASVDGVGPVIEYMRRRTDWNKVIRNTEYCREYDNTNVDFNGLVSFLSVMRFYEVIDFCLETKRTTEDGKEEPLIDAINWALLETPKHLRVNNLPEKIKKDLIPKYEKFPDIQFALKMEPEPDVDIQDVFDYLLKGDEYYTGTKWEMHLFDVFPELKEYYIKPEDR